MAETVSTIKRLAIAVAAVLCALLFAGCGASVTVYDETENGVRYNTYEIAIDEKVLAAMNDGATLDRDGNKYTVEGYLYALFTDNGYALTDAIVKDGYYTVAYKKAVTNESELFKAGTPVKFEYQSTSTPFVRSYHSTSPNPFNGVREYYDGLTGSAAVLARLKNGVTAYDEYGESITVFAALDEAFPYLKGTDLDGLRLNYVQTRSDRMTSSGTSERVGSRTVRYTFSRYFDYSETVIEYDYKRAVSYGWYLFAVAAGATVYMLIRIAAAPKKSLM